MFVAGNWISIAIIDMTILQLLDVCFDVYVGGDGDDQRVRLTAEEQSQTTVFVLQKRPYFAVWV